MSEAVNEGVARVSHYTMRPDPTPAYPRLGGQPEPQLPPCEAMLSLEKTFALPTERSRDITKEGLTDLEDGKSQRMRTL